MPTQQSTTCDLLKTRLAALEQTRHTLAEKLATLTNTTDIAPITALRARATLELAALQECFGVRIDTTVAPVLPSWAQRMEENTPLGTITWNKERYAEALFLAPAQQTGSIKGEELLTLIQRDKIPVLNATVLDWLEQHPDQIPEEWKGRNIFFWGTIFRGTDGRGRVRCLCWNDGSWQVSFIWLDRGWDAGSPAVRLASKG